MPAQLTSEQVWREVRRQIFAVLATVTSRNQPRTVGIVYAVHEGCLYICTQRSSWKVRHILANPNVSLTVTIPKRIPFLPWIKIPPAVVSLQGEASIHDPQQAPREVLKALMRGLETSAKMLSELSVIRVRPRGEFLTYGVGVSLLTMRKPEEARGRAPV